MKCLVQSANEILSQQLICIFVVIAKILNGVGIVGKNISSNLKKRNSRGCRSLEMATLSFALKTRSNHTRKWSNTNLKYSHVQIVWNWLQKLNNAVIFIASNANLHIACYVDSIMKKTILILLLRDFAQIFEHLQIIIKHQKLSILTQNGPNSLWYWSRYSSFQ